MHPSPYLIVGLACLAANAWAESESPARAASGPDKMEIGRRTEALLELQRSELAAAPLLPMQGEVAARAYERYLDSFKSAQPGETANESIGKAVSQNRGSATGSR